MNDQISTQAFTKSLYGSHITVAENTGYSIQRVRAHPTLRKVQGGHADVTSNISGSVGRAKKPLTLCYIHMRHWNYP